MSFRTWWGIFVLLFVLALRRRKTRAEPFAAQCLILAARAFRQREY